jgi:hypothetical protein
MQPAVTPVCRAAADYSRICSKLQDSTLSPKRGEIGFAMRIYSLPSFFSLRSTDGSFGEQCRSRRGYFMVEMRRCSLGVRMISLSQFCRRNSFSIRIFSAKRLGTETIVLALARGLAGYSSAGSHNAFEVTVVTQTPSGNYADADLPFRVVRRPGIFQLRKLISDSDVVPVAGTALAPMLWGLWLNKPVIVEHHGHQAICPTGMLLKLPELSVSTAYFRQQQYGNVCGASLRRAAGCAPGPAFLAVSSLLAHSPRCRKHCGLRFPITRNSASTSR